MNGKRILSAFTVAAVLGLGIMTPALAQDKGAVSLSKSTEEGVEYISFKAFLKDINAEVTGKEGEGSFAQADIENFYLEYFRIQKKYNESTSETYSVDELKSDRDKLIGLKENFRMKSDVVTPDFRENTEALITEVEGMEVSDTNSALIKEAKDTAKELRKLFKDEGIKYAEIDGVYVKFIKSYRKLTLGTGNSPVQTGDNTSEIYPSDTIGRSGNDTGIEVKKMGLPLTGTRNNVIAIVVGALVLIGAGVLLFTGNKNNKNGRNNRNGRSRRQ